WFTYFLNNMVKGSAFELIFGNKLVKGSCKDSLKLIFDKMKMCSFKGLFILDKEELVIKKKFTSGIVINEKEVLSEGLYLIGDIANAKHKITRVLEKKESVKSFFRDVKK